MSAIQQLLTDHLDIWTAADTAKKSGRGRSSGNAASVYGIKKLRELILELAVRGKLVPQDENDEPASELLKRIEVEKVKLISEGKVKKSTPLAEITDDEKPFELPQGWEWSRLEFIGYTQTGATPSKSDLESFGSEIPFVKPGDIYPNHVEYSNEGLSFYGAEKSGRVAKSGSLLMVCIGTIGKCNLIEMNCSFNQQINSVTPYIFNSQYLLSVCRSLYFHTEAWSRSSSTTIAILNKGNWEKIFIPIPPIEEQHRIVTKVDELMALCDQLESQHSNATEAHEKLVSYLLGTLTLSQSAEDFNTNWQRIAAHFDTLFTSETSIDALKQTLLQLAVMGKLVPQDPNDEPASELLKRIQAEKAKLIAEGKIKKAKPLAEISDGEKPFDLPLGWEWVKFGSLIQSFSNGLYKPAKFYTDQGIISLRMFNIQDGNIDFNGAKRVEMTTIELKQFSLEAGDLLINRVNSKELVGKTALIPEFNEPLVYESMNMRARTFKGFIDPAYLNLYMKSTLVKEAIFSFAKEAISQASINQMQISLLSTPLPPYHEQYRIIAKVDELINICDQMKVRITSANQLQQKLADIIIVQ
jgi:type I restriction enzyme S subunit